MSVEMVSL